jgi:pimeloyl-ACP methyl ester carboxylesterase
LTAAELKPGSVRLLDGRQLAFSSLGPDDGIPVVYLHGAIGSPLRVSDGLLETIERAHLRWLCVQRPGFGRSDPLAERSIVSFADDVREFAAALGLTRIGVLGVSAGGPYALACGRALPDLVGAVAVCSSLSPLCAQWEVPGLSFHLRTSLRVLARHPGGCTRALDRAIAVAREHPEWILRVMRRGAPAPKDRELMADPEAGSTAVNGLLEATRGGVGGLVADFLVCSRPWGFAPEEVGVEVHLWHGLQDHLVPPEHAWQLASARPRCRAAFDPDEGHFFFRRRVEEIVTRLVEAAVVPIS